MFKEMVVQDSVGRWVTEFSGSRAAWMDQFKTDNIQNMSIGYLPDADKCVMKIMESKK